MTSLANSKLFRLSITVLKLGLKTQTKAEAAPQRPPSLQQCSSSCVIKTRLTVAEEPETRTRMSWSGSVTPTFSSALCVRLQVQLDARMQRERQRFWAPVSSPTAQSPPSIRVRCLSTFPLALLDETRSRRKYPLQKAQVAETAVATQKLKYQK